MKKTRHSIACWSFIVLMLLIVSETIVPPRAHAQWLVFDIPSEVSGGVNATTDVVTTVEDTYLALKASVLDGLAWALAKTLLQQMTASTVNWINSGFKGSPAFLTNPAGFFTNIGDQMTGQFISQTGILSGLCSPFNVDLRLALALGQANGSAGGGASKQNYTCTLSSIINNVKNSTVNASVGATVNGKSVGGVAGSVTGSGKSSIGGFTGGDFSQGGWPAFISLSQPSNNESGAYLQAQSDLAQSIGNKQDMTNQQLAQGNGFMSWQSCNDLPATANSTAPVGGTGNSSTNNTGSADNTPDTDTNCSFYNADGTCAAYDNGTGNSTTNASTGNSAATPPTNPWQSVVDQYQATYQNLDCVDANGNPGPEAGSNSCATMQGLIQQAQTKSDDWDSYNENNDPAVSGCDEYNSDGGCAQYAVGSADNTPDTDTNCSAYNPEGSCADNNTGSADNTPDTDTNCSAYNPDGSCADNNTDSADNSSDVSTDPATGNLQTCDTETPGSVISSSLTKSLGTGSDSLVAASQINEVIGSLLTQLVSKVLTSGLSSVSQKSPGGGPSYTDQMAAEQSPALANILQSLIQEVSKYVTTAMEDKAVLDQIVSVYSSLESFYASTITQCQSTDGSSATAAQGVLNNQVAPLLAQAQAQDYQAASEMAILTNIQAEASSTNASASTTQYYAAQFANMLQSGQVITVLDVSNAKSDLKAAEKTAAGLHATGVTYQMGCALSASTSTIPVAIPSPQISSVDTVDGIITGQNFTYATRVYAVSTVTTVQTDLMFTATSGTSISVDFGSVPPGDNKLYVVNPSGTSSGYEINIAQ